MRTVLGLLAAGSALSLAAHAQSPAPAEPAVPAAPAASATPAVAPAGSAATAPSPAAASAPSPTTAAAAPAPAPAPSGGVPETVVVTTKALGRGEARANSVVSVSTIQEQPAGLDPLKLVSRVPGLQVGSSDSLTGSFSMRLSMRGLNKEQIGVSIDGIPNGSTLSNGGTMPNRLIDSSNLEWIEVSQTAGDIGTPSNQALGGFIEFKTRDPARTAGGLAEISFGSYDFQRQFARIDFGQMALLNTRASLSASHNYVETWPGEHSGRSRRDRFDLKTLSEFGDGHRLRFTLGYSNLADNDYDALALRSQSTFKAVFEKNPNTDALTDAWTGNPAIDQNNRRTRGIASRELFTHANASFKLGESTRLEIKPYLHQQEGEGNFYVPYKQLPADGRVYSAVPAGGRPVATVQECYANQYARNASGALIPTSAVVFPSGVTAASLAAAGCPAAARFQMNPQAQWGAREATARLGVYDTDRRGVLGEVRTRVGESHALRAGGWFEKIDRTKGRNWYLATDPKTGPGFDESALYSVTQDRQYDSTTTMVYAQDKISLLDDRAELDIGLTAQRFHETYRSPVEFFGERALSVSSGVLPKLAALYRITDDLEVFTSASKNFSALPDSVFEGTAAVDAKNGVKPETSVNVDAGLRWSQGPHGLSFQAYSIDYRDRISIRLGNPNGDIFNRDATTSFLNQGGIKSRGFEITGRTVMGPVAFYANYAFNDAKYVEDTPAEGIRAGDPVLGAARHNAFAEVAWKPTGSTRLTLNAKYVGKAAGTYHEYTNGAAAPNTVTYPREYMPAYTLVGLSGSWTLPRGWTGALKKAELSFNIDNLTDKRYLGGLGMELTTANPLTSGRYFLGGPRTFFVALRAEI
jgi:outer membrane receptor protein involved in Fe transport